MHGLPLVPCGSQRGAGLITRIDSGARSAETSADIDVEILFLGNSAWGQDMEATTNDGRAVILMENHTWRFAETSSGGSAPSEPYKIPASSTRLVRSTRGDFGL